MKWMIPWDDPTPTPVFDIDGGSEQKKIKKLKQALAEWKEYANMCRIKGVGREKAVDELIRRGKITKEEYDNLRKKFTREVAKKEKFDLDKAQKKFMD